MNTTTVKTIISGGQTGIDQLGLKVAKFLGIATGGYAPQGYRTELGSNMSLRDEYNLIEDTTTSYGPRTHKNVVMSDGTVLFGDMLSAGSAMTINICNRVNAPYICNPTAEELKQWILDNKIIVLNVAGNRGSKLATHKLLEYRDILIKALTT